MTVCIAAISRLAREVVTASDLLLSTDEMSQEGGPGKVWPLSSTNRWIVMFAGDPSVAAAVLAAVRPAVANVQEAFAEVSAAFEQAIGSELERKINVELLSHLGLQREQFLKRGRVYLGDTEYGRMLYRINAASLDTTFLVAGFQPDQEQVIFEVSDRMVSRRHDHVGFHAIGTGSTRARAALHGRYDPRLPLADLIYRVCEAKCLAESAPTVGRDTYVIVTNPAGELRAVIPEAMEPIRRAWERYGKPPVPKQAQAAIETYLRKIVFSK